MTFQKTPHWNLKISLISKEWAWLGAILWLFEMALCLAWWDTLLRSSWLAMPFQKFNPWRLSIRTSGNHQ
jgi:hypothetical protein